MAPHNGSNVTPCDSPPSRRGLDLPGLGVQQGQQDSRHRIKQPSFDTAAPEGDGNGSSALAGKARPALIIGPQPHTAAATRSALPPVDNRHAPKQPVTPPSNHLVLAAAAQSAHSLGESRNLASVKGVEPHGPLAACCTADTTAASSTLPSTGGSSPVVNIVARSMSLMEATQVQLQQPTKGPLPAAAVAAPPSGPGDYRQLPSPVPQPAASAAGSTTDTWQPNPDVAGRGSLDQGLSQLEQRQQLLRQQQQLHQAWQQQQGPAARLQKQQQSQRQTQSHDVPPTPFEPSLDALPYGANDAPYPTPQQRRSYEPVRSAQLPHINHLSGTTIDSAATTAGGTSLCSREPLHFTAAHNHTQAQAQAQSPRYAAAPDDPTPSALNASITPTAGLTSARLTAGSYTPGVLSQMTTPAGTIVSGGAHTGSLGHATSSLGHGINSGGPTTIASSVPRGNGSGGQATGSGALSHAQRTGPSTAAATIVSGGGVPTERTSAALTVSTVTDTLSHAVATCASTPHAVSTAGGIVVGAEQEPHQQEEQKHKGSSGDVAGSRGRGGGGAGDGNSGGSDISGCATSSSSPPPSGRASASRMGVGDGAATATTPAAAAPTSADAEAGSVAAGTAGRDTRGHGGTPSGKASPRRPEHLPPPLPIPRDPPPSVRRWEQQRNSGGEVVTAGQGYALTPAQAQGQRGQGIQGQGPLPGPGGNKPGRLLRAWVALKRVATCSNAQTSDPPLHGVTVAPGERVVVAATAEPELVPRGAGGAEGLDGGRGGAAGAGGAGVGGTARAGEPSGPQAYQPTADAGATGKQRLYAQRGGPLSSSPGTATAAAPSPSPSGAAAATQTPGPGQSTSTITVQPDAADPDAAVAAPAAAGGTGKGDGDDGGVGLGSGSAHLAVATAPEHALPQAQGSSSDRSPHHHTGYLTTLNVQPKQGSLAIGAGGGGWPGAASAGAGATVGPQQRHPNRTWATPDPSAPSAAAAPPPADAAFTAPAAVVMQDRAGRQQQHQQQHQQQQQQLYDQQQLLLLQRQQMDELDGDTPFRRRTLSDRSGAPSRGVSSGFESADDEYYDARSMASFALSSSFARYSQPPSRCESPTAGVQSTAQVPPPPAPHPYAQASTAAYAAVVDAASTMYHQLPGILSSAPTMYPPPLSIFSTASSAPPGPPTAPPQSRPAQLPPASLPPTGSFPADGPTPPWPTRTATPRAELPGDVLLSPLVPGLANQHMLEGAPPEHGGGNRGGVSALVPRASQLSEERSEKHTGQFSTPVLAAPHRMSSIASMRAMEASVGSIRSSQQQHALHSVSPAGPGSGHVSGSSGAAAPTIASGGINSASGGLPAQPSSGWGPYGRASMMGGVGDMSMGSVVTPMVITGSANASGARGAAADAAAAVPQLAPGQQRQAGEQEPRRVLQQVREDPDAGASGGVDVGNILARVAPLLPPAATPRATAPAPHLDHPHDDKEQRKDQQQQRQGAALVAGAVVVATPVPEPHVEAVPRPLQAERPHWVPHPPVPGLDPSIRFVPVPPTTPVAGYWAKVPERSAPSPMPIDLALKAGRVARSVHESIKGILLRDEPSALVLKARLTLPLGIRMTHEERYPRDNSSHTSLVRRDVSAGRSITRMYYTADDDVLLICESADLLGRVDHVGYELMRVTQEGAGSSAATVIICRQWVDILDGGRSVGRMAEQAFVGRKAPLPDAHHS